MTGTHVPLLGSDLYGIAYLAGGPRRVVEAAVVALVEDGRLGVTGATAELHVLDPRRRHPVEAAVLDATGLHCSVGIGDTTVRAKTATDLGKLA